jgi:hypothetical protein
MLIQSVPEKFQPNYVSTYPCYSSGKNMEEIIFEILKEKQKQNDIKTEYIYLPIFWTSYYVIQNYGENIDDLYEFLETLDKSKKYFTIVQYASGIFVKNYNLNITVFTSGGGGLNMKNYDTIHEIDFYGIRRHIFYGSKGTYDIPLMCLPQFPETPIVKDIFCSFMGRFDTHKCRIDMKQIISNSEKYKLFESVNYDVYKNLINRSIFTLAPRGFGYTSFRLIEAILANSIPIYIWDDKITLPFSDELEWSTFCVIIQASELDNLDNILTNINIQEMQNNLSKVKQLFTFENTVEYIIQKLI